MVWFVFALVCLLGWGFADLFYKKGTDDEDRYSHLKIAVWVGLVMGISSLILLPFSEIRNVAVFFTDMLKYSPASVSYILSMVIGYAGLRYLELSVVSPVQNASGAFSAIAILLYFLFRGKIGSITEELGIADFIGVFLIVVGMILLAVTENRLSKDETEQQPSKYRYGLLALVCPLLYCLFDTIGTAADGIILDGSVGLGLSEIDVLIIYGFTFFLAGLLCWVFLWVKGKKPYNPFGKTEWPKGAAAVCEEFGQVFYVYAMARNPVLAAPVVASYCIVSVLLSRVFIKEKLSKMQYICVFIVIAGIVVLGIAEGLAEM